MIACAAACLINGNGLEGALHPLRFTQLHMLPLIDEWKPATPGRTPFFFGLLAIALALIAWKRLRLPWTRWLLLAALYNPIWITGIISPGDFALVAVAFLLLFMWQTPPWLVVVLSALGGALLGMI